MTADQRAQLVELGWSQHDGGPRPDHINPHDGVSIKAVFGDHVEEWGGGAIWFDWSKVSWYRPWGLLRARAAMEETNGG